MHLLFFNLQSCTEVLRHFCIFGAFSISHRPNPSPHPTNKVGSMYPEFFPSFKRKFQKRMYCFMRQPRNNRKILILDYCPKDFCPRLQSWTEVSERFTFLGGFPIHTGPTPPLTPQTKLEACFQIFFGVSTLYRVGRGRTARKFQKGCSILILDNCPRDFCLWL